MKNSKNIRYKAKSLSQCVLISASAFVVLFVFSTIATAGCYSRSYKVRYDYECPWNPSLNFSEEKTFSTGNFSSCRSHSGGPGKEEEGEGSGTGNIIFRHGGSGNVSNHVPSGGGGTVCAPDPEEEPTCPTPKLQKSGCVDCSKPKKDKREFAGSWVNLVTSQYEDSIVDFQVPHDGGVVSVSRMFQNNTWSTQKLYPLDFSLRGSKRISLNNHSIGERPNGRDEIGISNVLFIETTAGSGVYKFKDMTLVANKDASQNVIGYRKTNKDGSWMDYSAEGLMIAIGLKDRTDLLYYYVQGHSQAHVNNRKLDYIAAADGTLLVDYEYDNSGYLVSIANFDQSTVLNPDPYQNELLVSYLYDENGFLSDVIQPDGTHYFYENDVNGNIVHKTKTAADGELLDERFITYNYAGPDRSSTVEGESGGGGFTETRSSFDAMGKAGLDRYVVSSVTDGSGVVKYFESDYNSKTKEYYALFRDGAGVVTESWYDQTQRLVQRKINGEVSLQRSVSDVIVRSIDSDGGATVEEYDEWSNKVRVTNPDGTVEQWSYEPRFHRIASHTDAEGVKSEWTYQDDLTGGLYGAVSTVTQTQAVGTSLQRSMISGYDALERQVFQTDYIGTTTVYEYDGSHNRVTRRYDALEPGRQTLYEYDVRGNRIKTTDALGRVSLEYYDVMNNRVASVDAKGVATLWMYSNDRLFEVVSGVVLSQLSVGLPAAGTHLDVKDLLTQNSSYFSNPESEIRRIRYAYDDAGRQTATYRVDYEGIEQLLSRTEYDAAGRVMATYNALDQSTLYSYDGYGYLNATTELGTEGQLLTTSFENNVDGQRLSLTDPAGTRTEFEYDSMDQLIQVTEAAGTSLERRIASRYDVRGYLIERAIQVPTITGDAQAGYVADYQAAEFKRSYVDYDDLGRKIKEYGFGQYPIVYSWDANDNLRSQTDARGLVVRNEYDTFNRPVRTYSDEVLIATYEYDLADNLLATEDAEGYRNRRRYNSLNQLSHVSIPFAGAAPQDWHSQATWTEAEIAYSKFGEILSESSPVASVDAVDAVVPTTLRAYDAFGRLEQVAVPDGQISTFEYSVADQIARIYYEAVSSSGSSEFSQESFEYSPHNARLRTRSVNRAGLATLYDYNDRLQASQVTVQSGFRTEVDYDELGRAVAQRILKKEGEDYTLHSESSTVYDAFDRSVAIVQPDDTVAAPRIQYQEFDDYGNLVRTRGAGSQPAAYAYDAAGNLIELTTWNQSEVSQANVTARLDVSVSNAATTQWEYDLRGRLLKKTYPDATDTAYTWLDNDRMQTSRDGKGQVVSYAYNPRGQVTLVDYPTDADVSFGYDAAGRRNSMQDGVGETTWTHYATGRLSSENQPQVEASLAYHWDEGGRRARLEATVGNADFADALETGASTSSWTTAYSYDNFGRLKGLSDSRVSSTPFSYEWQTDSSLVKRVSHPSGASETRYRYDPLQQLVDIGAYAPTTPEGGTAIHGVSSTYNELGQRVTETPEGGAIRSFAYDELRQLSSSTGAISETYTYDLSGNRLTADVDADSFVYASNLANQYTTIELNAEATPFAPSYDLNGSQENARSHATGEVSQYVWDEANRLVSVVIDDQTKVSFTYDGLSRRVKKLISQWNGSSWVGQMRISYLFDGRQLLAEFEETLSSSEVAATTYTRGLDVAQSLDATNGIGALLAVRQPSGEVYYPQADNVGHITAYLNGSGTVVATYDYNAFGYEVSSSGLADEFNFRASSKYYDTETRLVQYFYRYYNPEDGRWTNRDPIEEQGGLNLYGMIGNDPINQYDVLGLSPVDCAKLAKEIVVQAGKLAKEFAKYDPVEDAKGGFPIPGLFRELAGKLYPKRTKPGGHYKEMLDLKKGLWNRLNKFKEKCWDDDDDDCDNPPEIPVWVWKEAKRFIPPPVKPLSRFQEWALSVPEESIPTPGEAFVYGAGGAALGFTGGWLYGVIGAAGTGGAIGGGTLILSTQ